MSTSPPSQPVPIPTHPLSVPINISTDERVLDATATSTATATEAVTVVNVVDDIGSSLDQQVQFQFQSQSQDHDQDGCTRPQVDSPDPSSFSKPVPLLRWTLDAQRAHLPRPLTRASANQSQVQTATSSLLQQQRHSAPAPETLSLVPKRKPRRIPGIPKPHDRKHLIASAATSPSPRPKTTAPTTRSANMRLSPSSAAAASSATAPRPLSSGMTPVDPLHPHPPSPSPSSMSAPAAQAPHHGTTTTTVTKGKVIRHALRSFASSLGLKSLVNKDKLAPPGTAAAAAATPPAVPRAMSEIGPAATSYTPPRAPILSLPRLSPDRGGTDLDGSNVLCRTGQAGPVPLPVPYVLATPEGGSYYQSGPVTTPPTSPGEAAGSARKRSRGASILFDGLDWDVRDLSVVLAAIGDAVDEYPAATGRIASCVTNGSDDDDLDKFYDAHAEAFAAETRLVRQSRDADLPPEPLLHSMPLPAPVAAALVAGGPSRQVTPDVGGGSSDMDDGASTRAITTDQHISPNLGPIVPPRRVDSLLAPTLSSLAASSVNNNGFQGGVADDSDHVRKASEFDVPVGHCDLSHPDADSTAMLLALPARERFGTPGNLSPTRPHIAAAASTPRREGTAESDDSNADAFAGMAAMTGSLLPPPPVVPVRSVSLAAPLAVQPQLPWRDATDVDAMTSPKRTLTPPSSSRFVGGGQGTLRRRGATMGAGEVTATLAR